MNGGHYEQVDENHTNVESPGETSIDVIPRPYLCTGFDAYVTREPCAMWVYFFTTSICGICSLSFISYPGANPFGWLCVSIVATLYSWANTHY